MCRIQTLPFLELACNCRVNVLTWQLFTDYASAVDASHTEILVTLLTRLSALQKDGFDPTVSLGYCNLLQGVTMY